MTRVLVAEDQGAISIALEDTLGDEGYAVAGPFSTCSRAHEWLQHNTPDLALLDVWLSDGPCFDLARTLQDRNVSIVFVSATRPDGVPQDLEVMPWQDRS
jgi:DNA-binding response OmpR family regulator